MTELADSGDRMGPVVVVGAGQAGVQTASSLRQAGYRGRLTLVGDEEHRPYERPPLSKAFLKGDVELTDIALRPNAFFTEQDIELRLDRAVSIDAARRVVLLASGAHLPYDHLVLATGARARRLPIPGAEADGVLGLRTAADATTLRDKLRRARSTCVIGGGFIGLEFASVAAALGVGTTVVEQGERTMARVATPRLSAHLEALHRGRGVRLVLGTTVEEMTVDQGRVTAVCCCDGTVIDADLVVVGVGVSVDASLAESASLAVTDHPGGGILVDEYLLTSNPSISAVGDCAVFPCAHADGAPVRLESVQNAADHARAVAARLTGDSAPYQAVPWFWSDQFDTRVQIAGLTTGHDEVIVHGDPDGGRFSHYCFRDGRLVGVESVNRPGDHVAARRILARSQRPSRQEVEDPGFDPKVYARRARSAA